MFKIIAIKTNIRDKRKYLRTDAMSDYQIMAVDLCCARYDSVMKVLKPDTVYWFQKGYILDEYGLMTSTNEVIDDEFFIAGMTEVSVNAIVGENGMGKSSLLELAFRMLNNVSYALKDGLVVQGNSLRFVRDIYSTLWFENNGCYYKISQEDGIVSFFDQSRPDNDWQYDYDNPNEQSLSEAVAKKRLAKLFYTIVINYSQFAYNPTDYLSEWDDYNIKNEEVEDSQCWLTNLFHKNDAYQTPIVLNPFRERGNININVERDLTHTRLYKLVLADHSPLRRILRNKDVESFQFDIDDDLNPIPTKRYCSKRVLRQLVSMRRLDKMRGNIDFKKVNDIGKRIVNAWGHSLGYSIEEKEHEKFWGNMDDVRTINYIVYKTLKISATYAKYYKYHDCFDDMRQVQKYVYELSRDNSHITLKIRRCLAYLFFHHYSTGTAKDGHVTGNEMPIAEYQQAIDNCFLTADIIFESLIKSRYTTYYGGIEVEPHIWVEDELLPAPSFRTDIKMRDNNGDVVKFSTLSSGEKQMIFSMCTLIYQLSNIDSVWDDIDSDNVKYDSVCVVFDEIELYAHPKYQLMLINFLLDSISSLNLMHIRSVNIILATHSPFILSDLPASNILMLKDGKPYIKDDVCNTFCANVYDILNNHFFMSRSVGDFANSKLMELANEINELREKDSEERKSDIRKKIQMIGDSFVRNAYLNKLSSYDSDKL